MTVPPEKIVAAAKMLEDFRLKGLIGGVSFSLTPRQIHAFMMLVEAAPLIIKAFEAPDVLALVYSEKVLRVEYGITLPDGYSMDTQFFNKGGIFRGIAGTVENAFEFAEIKTVGDLARRDRGIRFLPRFGPVALAKVKERLKECGFNPDQFWCLKNSLLVSR